MPAAPPTRSGTEGIAITLAELIAARPEARRLGLGAGAHGLTAGAGGHLSRLRGPGVAYAESRPYVPGDDPRAMDWRVTARAARPHVKVYQEERERPVWLVVDQGRSMHFGTRVAFKSVIAARAAALLAWGALAHGDRVGGLVLAGNCRHWQPPARRERGVLGLLRALTQTPAMPVATPGFTTALAALQRPAPSGATTVAAGAAIGAAIGATGARPAARALLQPGSLVFLISDFADLLPGAAAWLTRLADHSTVVLILVYDPLEAAAPNADPNADPER